MIDITIIACFLIMTLVVGLSHGRKVKTIKEYAIGNRDFSTGAIVATLVATWISGSTFFIALSKTYSSGLYYVFASSGMALAFLLTAFVFVPRMGKLLGKISIAEVMGDWYGKHVRMITAISGIIGEVGIIAVQFKVFGSLFNYFFGISNSDAILIASLIVIFYSTFGGIKAVTSTDIVQFFAFGLSIPIVGVIIWNSSYQGGVDFSNAIASSKFNISDVLDIRNPEFLQMIPLFLYFALPGMVPKFCQRILMGKDIKQLKKAFIISAILLIIILGFIQWIPFLLFNVDPNIESGKLFSYIIDNYTYPGLKGILLVGIISMAMSSADSAINASSVLFSNDICTPLKIGVKYELLISKIFAFCLGVFAIFLALSDLDLLSTILVAKSFYMPIVTTPLMATILGFRTGTKPVLIGMFAGAATVVIWKMLGIDVDPIAFAMLVNFVFLMGSHYLLRQAGGWIGQTSIESEEEKESIFTKIRNYYQNNSFSFLEYCKNKSPSNDISYVGLGIYFIIFTITTMYNTQTCLIRDYCGWVIYIYQVMIVLSVVVASYPIWPASIDSTKRLSVAKILWPISIFFMLIMCNSFFILISNFSSLQFAVFTANLFITANIFGWRLAPPLIVIGCMMSVGFYSYFGLDKLFATKMESPAFIIIYVLALLGAIFVIFLKPKQEQHEEIEVKIDVLGLEVTDLNEKVDHYSERVSDQEKEIERLGATAQKILNNVNHELRLPVGNVMNFAEMLNEGLGKFNESQLKMLSDEVYKNSNRLSSMIMNMLDLATLEAKNLELNKSTINLGELIHDRVQSCRKMYLDNKKIDFEMQIEEDILIKVDPNYIRQTVDNLVINAINFSQEGVIKISLLRKNNIIEFIIKDEGVGIPQKDIYDIFTPFKMGSNTESKAEGRGVGLALCKAAIEAHGGVITVESKGGKGAVFKFVL